MAAESAEPIERWTAKRRVALVVSILKGETSVAEAARAHGLAVAATSPRLE
jgi:transposase-like protein